MAAGKYKMFACCSVTCVDEILVGEARVVHVVDGRGEDGGHHLQRRENALSNRKYFLELIKYFSSALTSSAGELRRT